MFLSRNQIPIRTKKLIVELALRNGSPTLESPSPYNGLLDLTFKRMSASEQYNKDFDGAIYQMLNAQPDYNADNQCPIFDQPWSSDAYLCEARPAHYNPELGNEAVYCRRLEDIDPTWVVQYVDNILFSIGRNKEGGMRAYARNNHTVNVFVDEEDGEVMLETDNLTNIGNGYSAEDVYKAKERIPYLLRRLHDKSKQSHIHIISLLAAHEMAKKSVAQANMQKSYKSSLSPKDLLYYPIYRMNPDGTLGPMLAGDANNRDTYFKAIKGWLFQYPDSIDSYTQDAIDLLHYFDVMEIDITKEDVTVYQEEYISQLTVLYITSNREYILRKRPGFHKEVYDTLTTLSLDTCAKADSISEDPYSIVENTINIFNNSSSLEDTERNALDVVTNADSIDRDILVLLTYYNIVFRRNIQLDKLITMDGFFFTDTETPLMIDLSPIMKNTSGAYKDVAIVRESGHIVRLSKLHKTEYIICDNLLYHLKDCYESKCMKPIDKNYWRTIYI